MEDPMKKIAIIFLVVLLSIFVMYINLGQSDVYALPGSQKSPARWVTIPAYLSVTYAPMVLSDYQSGNTDYVVGVPMVINSDDQNAPVQGELPPIPCLGGILLVIAAVLSMLVKTRNSISIS